MICSKQIKESLLQHDHCVNEFCTTITHLTKYAGIFTLGTLMSYKFTNIGVVFST